MTAACCSWCDTNIWVKEVEVFKPVMEISPSLPGAEIPVGGRVWCNFECFKLWHAEHPEQIVIVDCEYPADAFTVESKTPEDLPLEHHE